MKTAYVNNYGPPNVFEIKDVEMPKTGAKDLLVKVYASSVSAAALIIRSGKHPDSKLFTLMTRLMFGLNKPKNPILGYEFSGVVESVGNDVTLFKPGDKVYGTTTGLKQGAYAEYVCIPESWGQGVIDIIPEGMSFDEAAVLPVGAMTAMDLLEKAGIQKGDKVLIYGASGSVGTYAVQLAKQLGAEVTGVCSSANLELVLSIGADFVVDYRKQDISKLDKTFNVVFDAVGKISKGFCKKILGSTGRFIGVKSPTTEKQVYLSKINELVESGMIKPVIDLVYPLDKIAEAHAYADTGHKKGNLVIKIID